MCWWYLPSLLVVTCLIAVLHLGCDSTTGLHVKEEFKDGRLWEIMISSVHATVESETT